MNTPTSNTTLKQQLEPHVVRDRLAKDIRRILSDSLHHFDEVDQEIEDKSFDVDGVVSGRPSREQHASVRRSLPQANVRPYTSGQQAPVNAYTLTVPSRGNFIPSTHFSNPRPQSA